MDMLKHPGMADMPELLEKLDALRGEGKKIVFTNGCYDILHPGHVDLLERCKAQGDVLVLGLNSDETAGQGRRPARQSVSCAGLCAGASGKRGFRGPVRRGYAREAHRGRTARRAGQRRGLVRGSHRRPGIGATARR